MTRILYETYKAMVEAMDEVVKQGKDFRACCDNENKEYWLEVEE